MTTTEKAARIGSVRVIRTVDDAADDDSPVKVGAEGFVTFGPGFAGLALIETSRKAS